MIRLIQFEMRKLFRSTFFRILLLAFCLFIVVYYVFVHMNTIRTGDLIRETEGNIHRDEQPVQELRDAIDSGEIEEDNQIKEEIELWEQFVSEHKVKLKGYEEEDWATLLNLEIEDVAHDYESNLFKREYYTSSWPTLFTQETRLEQNKWLRDKKIVPVLPIDSFSWLTVYDVAFSVENDPEEILKNFVEKHSKKYSSTGVYYLNHVFGLLFGVLGAGFFLFLFGDIVTKEGLRRNGPINLLQTQPIHRGKIVVSKFITVLILSALILIGTGIISLLLGTVFDRFGDWNYPVLIYGEEYMHSFMNMSTFIIKSMMLFFMVLLFCFSLLFLFSILTKKALIALGLTLVALFMGIRLSEESVLSSFAPYVPFHYFAAPQVVTMELAATLKNFSFTFTNGLVVLGISSAVLLAVTYVVSVIQYKYGR